MKISREILFRLITASIVVIALTSILGMAEYVVRLSKRVPAPLRIPTVFESENAQLYGWGYSPHFPILMLNPGTGETEAFDYTNSRGWKDVEHSYENVDNKFRILVVGDSITQGMPALPDVFHRVLEGLLQSSGYRAEVIALGVSGWATDQEYMAYRNEGIKYHPHLIISQFCPNDLDGLNGEDRWYGDSLKPFNFQVVNGDMKIERRERQVPKPSALKRLDKVLTFNSRLYLFGRNVYVQNLAPLGQKQALKKQFLESLTCDETGFSSVGEETPVQKQVWNLYQAILQDWKKECEANGSELICYTNCREAGELEFGLKWYLKEEGGKTLQKLSDGIWGEVDFKKPIRRFDEVCHKIGVNRIPSVRLTQCYEYDPHANTQGNRAMAEDIHDYLLAAYREKLEPFRDRGEKAGDLALVSLP